MCLIIDANVVHKVFPTPSGDFEPIHKAVIERRAWIVYGGKLTDEYQAIGKFWRILARLDQQGSARQVPNGAVVAETEALRRSGLCRSDDPHILALARVGRVRLLCSNDDDLAVDFTDRRILSDPRGNVYKRVEHSRLIRKHCHP